MFKEKITISIFSLMKWEYASIIANLCITKLNIQLLPSVLVYQWWCLCLKVSLYFPLITLWVHNWHNCNTGIAIRDSLHYSLSSWASARRCTVLLSTVIPAPPKAALLNDLQELVVISLHLVFQIVQFLNDPAPWTTLWSALAAVLFLV